MVQEEEHGEMESLGDRRNTIMAYYLEFSNDAFLISLFEELNESTAEQGST